MLNETELQGKIDRFIARKLETFPDLREIDTSTVRRLGRLKQLTFHMSYQPKNNWHIWRLHAAR